MKAVIPYILIAIAGAAICFVLIRGCSKTPLPSSNTSAADSLARAFTAYKAAAENRADSFENEIMIRDDSIANLSREMSWDEAQLSDQGDQIDATMRLLDSARSHRDTIQIVVSCDSLEGQVRVAKSEAVLYRGTADSLVNVLIRQGQVKDSLTANWKAAFLHTDSTQVMWQDLYSTLNLNYSKQASKLKFTSNLGKVLGGAAAALLVGLLIKK